MKNLEQVRAKNALEASLDGPISGKNEGEVIKKIPPLIINHGLLAIGAYAFSNDAYRKVIDAIVNHLACEEIKLVPEYVRNTATFMEYLCTEADSNKLRLITSETMAWLNYARRFIKKG